MAMDELKSCPFCASPVTLHRYSWEVPGGRAKAFWVRCWKCGAFSDEFESESEAKKAWNRRVGVGNGI